MNRTMKKLITSLIFFSWAFSIYAQSYTDKLAIVELLEGNWKGNLSYLNFQDDKTRGTVDLEIKGVRSENEVELKYTYYNNGVVVREGKDKVVADNNANKFNFNDVWDLESFEKTGEDEYVIVLSTKGKDYGKRSLMRKTINISASNLTIRRDIKYLKADTDYFNRHIYRLEKQ